MNNNEYLICPSCGFKGVNGKFCPECGQLLNSDNVIPVSDVDTPSLNTNIKQEEREALSAEGLTLLVNTCKKTIATVGGDGYSEIVLYLDEKTNTYWLHTYSKYVYMEKEAHASYIANKELVDEVFKYLEDNNIASMINNKGFALCGGDYILKFKHNNEIIRLDSSNMMDKLDVYSNVSNMLYSGIIEENRRYKDDQ